MIGREIIAYGLIALTVLTSAPVGIWFWHKRRRIKLRRQGIKRYGH